MLCVFRNEKETYEEWFEKFLKEDLGSQMISINFYLLEYKNLKDDFIEIYGNKLNKIISENFEFFSDFDSTWFDDDVPFFKGLHLSWDGLEDEIKQTEKNDDGTLKTVEFNDGSIIKFLDEDDSIKSFYVAEEEYEDLVDGIENLIKTLSPNNL